jgi:polyisoprenoid-binding protein YceI
MRRCAAALLLCAALAAAPAVLAARGWSVREGGTLGFTADWEGTGFDGVFHRFAAEIDFDPADLAGSRFDVTVDVTSADTRSSDRDEGLADPEWFDYAHFPRATFVTSAFRALGEGRFEATGMLTIKGISRELALPFAWEEREGVAHLRGEATLVRTDFRIGEGEWADGDVVGLTVLVKVDLELAPAAGGS